ncbi:hypothetical protein MRX96_015260 [Rhipicephalus microplus]
MSLNVVLCVFPSEHRLVVRFLCCLAAFKSCSLTPDQTAMLQGACTLLCPGTQYVSSRHGSFLLIFVFLFLDGGSYAASFELEMGDRSCRLVWRYARNHAIAWSPRSAWDRCPERFSLLSTLLDTISRTRKYAASCLLAESL